VARFSGRRKLIVTFVSPNPSSAFSWAQVPALLARRRWWFLVSLAAGWLAVVSLQWLLPPRYISQSLLLVDQQSVPSTYVRPNVAFNPDAMLQALGQQVLSDSRLAQIIRDYNLYPTLIAAQGMDAGIAKMRGAIAIQPVTLASLPAPPPGDWSAISIAFSAPSAALAQAVDNRLTTIFIQQNLRATQQASAGTTSFLAEQVATAQQQVQQAQHQVQAYERAHLGLLPGQDQANLTMVMTLQSELGASLAALDRNQQQIATDRNWLRESPSTAAEQRATELASLRRRLQALRGRYTDRYPDVQRLKLQIAALAAAPAAGAAAPAPAAPLTATTAQVRSRMQAAQALLPRQQAQVAQLRRQLALYERRLTLAPVPAAQLAALQSQLRQAQASYQVLAAKLANSRMASQLEQRQGGAQFRLVNPSNLPRVPAWPNPVILSLGGLGLGLILGIGVGALAELVGDRVRGEAELLALGVAPVLAHVPPLRSRAEASRRRSLATLEWIGGAALMAVLVLGNLWLLRAR
jgi:polysaccharide chain length determinant protein (PEP-CTERM system associated)